VVSQDFTQGHIQRLNGIRRIDGFVNVSGESKEGDNPLPVGHPGFTEGGIASVPCRRKVHESRLSVRGRYRAIDGFEVCARQDSPLRPGGQLRGALEIKVKTP